MTGLGASRTNGIIQDFGAIKEVLFLGGGARLKLGVLDVGERALLDVRRERGGDPSEFPDSLVEPRPEPAEEHVRGRDRRRGRGQVITDPPVNVRSEAKGQGVLVEGVALGIVQFPDRKVKGSEVPFKTECPCPFIDIGGPKPDARSLDGDPVCNGQK